MKGAKRKEIERRLHAIQAADWEARFRRTSSRINRLEDHLLRLCGDIESLLDTLQASREANNELRHQKRVLIEYLEKIAKVP